MAERSEEQVKRSHRGGRPSYKEFASSTLHVTFERHVKDAQDAFLAGDHAAAEREATQALRIRPTPHLFALMAVVAEAKGQYDRASDFRLLQAFLAKDTVLWEELLHEFLSQQLYYKSVVCLQRLSALEKGDADRYRTLQLQLADLLVGLGEIRRAASVLVPLWNRSRCRDFEVFAQLASLYFQLGKWNSLEGLIASSLKYAFHVDHELANEEDDGTAPPRKPRRVGVKRVRFDDDNDDEGEQPEVQPVAGAHSDKTAVLSEVAPSAEELVSSPADDFGFDELMGEEEGGGGGGGAPLSSAALGPTAPWGVSTTGTSPSDSVLGRLGGRGSQQAERASQSLRKQYGDHVALQTEEEKQNFLTLVNVHTELLNERGRYTETIRLVEMTAGTIGVELLELPPDLLIRLGTAYAYQGELEQPCREVFQNLLETCSMDEYGDVLLDAATTLQKVGMHRDALQLYETITRYHEFRLLRLREQKSSVQAALAAEEPDHDATATTAATTASSSLASLLKQVHTMTTSTPHAQSLRAELAELCTEEGELTTVVAAGLYGQARCHYALRDHANAEYMVCQALSYEPNHLQGRLLLGRIRFYDNKDVEGAVTVLTPMENEPGLYRLQLGAALVGVFKRANKLFEAIALGVSIFELILSSSEDGDAESVAPGSSTGQRRGVKLYMPSLSRASSSIIPASSLSAMLHGPASSAAGSTTSRRLSSSIAASVKASSTVFAQQLRRRGMSALTTTVYGASAAASIAAGWDRKEEESRLQDSSTIFRFSRRRRRGAADTKEEDVATQEDAKHDEMTSEDVRRRERAETIVHMPAEDFWAPTGAESHDAAGVVVDKHEDEEDEKKHSATTTDIKAEDQQPDERDAPTRQAASPSSTARKRRRGGTTKKTNPAEATRAQLANMSTTESRDDDLAELEAFAKEAEAEADAGLASGTANLKRRRTETDSDTVTAALVGHDEQSAETGEEPLLESYELPSLDEISQQFNDPTLSKLFLDATSNFSLNRDGGGGGAAAAVDPWAAAHQNPGGAEVDGIGSGGAGGGLSPELHKVTMREALEALGRTELVSLATTVVECYSLLGHFSEAKEFAYMTLVKLANRSSLRGSGEGIERPLRVAILQSALAAGEAEDAFRVGLNLLLQDSTDEEKTTVVELLHRVLNTCGPAASGGILLRAVLEGQNEVPMVVLLANRYYLSGSYLRALNLYLVALAKRPEDALLNWMTGLLFILVSHQRRIRSREACVSAGAYYLQRYETLISAVSPARTGEAVYNVARVLQYLRLHHLCIPLYQRVATDLPVPERCSLALRRAAQFNLYYVLRWHSGNRTLALSMLPFAGAESAHEPIRTETSSSALGDHPTSSLHSPFA